MKRTVLVSFLAIVALGLLVAFAFNSRSVPVGSHIAQHTLSLELDQAQQDFRSIVDSLAGAVRDTATPDTTVIAAEQRFSASAYTIESHIDTLAQDGTNVQGTFENFQLAVERASPLIQSLIESQTAFAESAVIVRDSGPEIVERMRDIALADAAAQTFQLIVGTVDFTSPDSTVRLTDLQRLHATLNSNAQLDANMSREKGSLLGAVATILDSRDQIREDLRALSDIAVPAAGNSLAESVNASYGAAVAAADGARTMLAIYAIVLFAAVAFVGFRLRSSYAQINKANTELASLNESLEQRVIERTEELSSALAELKESQVQLVQAEKMSSLGQLVAGISHEINTPLLYLANNAALVSERIDMFHSYLEKSASAFALDRNEFSDRADYQSKFVGMLLDLKKTLRDDELNAAAEEARDLMRDSIDGIGDLTEMAQSLKDFSRLDRAPTGRFDINSGIEKTLLIARNVIKDKAEVKKEFGELPEIECSPSKINQVFLNLVTNAAQAIEGRGEIVIRSEARDDDRIAVAISDTGCGISPENLEKIRDPFFTTKEVGSGTGLGLSIVEEIVRGHGGELVIESRLGEGSTFTVLLPIRQKTAAENEDDAFDEAIATLTEGTELDEGTAGDLAEAV